MFESNRVKSFFVMLVIATLFVGFAAVFSAEITFDVVGIIIAFLFIALIGTVAGIVQDMRLLRKDQNDHSIDRR